MSDRAILESFCTSVEAGEAPATDVLNILAKRLRAALDGRSRCDRLFSLKSRGRRQVVSWCELAGWYFWLRSQEAFRGETDLAIRGVVAKLTGMSASTVRDAADRHGGAAKDLAREVRAEQLKDPQRLLRRLIAAYPRPISLQEFRHTSCMATPPLTDVAILEASSEGIT
ncbi:MAG: hypothetical protein QM808_16280 [Steroidobacteraceae bacterium]